MWDRSLLQHFPVRGRKSISISKLLTRPPKLDNCASSQIGNIRMKDTLKMQVEELKVQFNCNVPAEGTWGSYYCWTEMLRALQQFWMVFDVEHWDFILIFLRVSNGMSHKHKEAKLNQLLWLEFYRVLLRWKVHRSLMALVLLATITAIVHLFVTSFFCPPFSSHHSRRGKELWLYGARCVLQSEGLRIRSQPPPWASFCKSSCLMWHW